MKLPERLCVVDGELKMKDGSDVRTYLQNTNICNCESVVLIGKKDLEELVNRLVNDRMFPLAG